MSPQRPNILMIMLDQLRFDYLGYNGAKHVDTPNIDVLAKNGMVFSNCFTNAPVCAPARIGLATGMHPSHIGVLDNQVSLSLNYRTYYQSLRDNGYQVDFVGKLDLAKVTDSDGVRGERPCNYSYGFTKPFEVEGKREAARAIEPIGPYTQYLKEKGVLAGFHARKEELRRADYFNGLTECSHLETEDYIDTFVANRVIKTIYDMEQDFPWYLQVNFLGPHDPFDPPEVYADIYADRQMPVSIISKEEKSSNWVKRKKKTLSEEQQLRAKQQYAAYIRLLDEQIGRIIDALKMKGSLESTYIILTSDHGDMLGDFSLFGKHMPYESAIHIPLLISGPKISSGICEELVELIDVNPTIQDLAGISQQPIMDGKSLASILSGQSKKHRDAIISEERNFRCVRTRRYKYIEYYNDKSELYDLYEDPCELINIYHDHYYIAKRLSEFF
ncbi:sulfatase family protein [Vallitalea okinawensis]|uniref:sulfatase family protein n=1 Tax=Vallitalea okinawensis TaxID=2078660 RepID=UPI000CFDB940|nr:sulfatase-like hydrolase/transferase [Vallitalea okinawensis]